MKEQIETAVPRSKFVASDSDEARKTATGHSCKTLVASLTWASQQNKKWNQSKSIE